jgi:protein involved in polysaccharide export with SLBB domain
MVFVTGQVNTPGSFPYRPELKVSDYILYAGGIVDNIGDPNGIFFVDEKGKRTKVNLTDPVDPGTNIYVAKNLLFKSDQFVKNFLITTGWVTAIIGVATTIIQFIQLTQDL